MVPKVIERVGNQCYIISSLQLLFSDQRLINSLIEINSLTIDQAPFINLIVNIYQHVQIEPIQPITNKFLDELRKEVSSFYIKTKNDYIFDDGGQKDASEFYEVMINYLKALLIL